MPFGPAFTEYLLASGDFSMWVTITKAELASQCGDGNCRNCVMDLTGSSNLGNPKQYCRAGSGEDPWISAGDHPDLIVYGEMSWANHHIGQDGSEDALQRGGSNVWINALPTAEVTGVGTVMTPTWTNEANVAIDGGNIRPSATSAWGTIGAEALEQITETSVS